MLALVLPLAAFGQAKITTKKMKIADFTLKTTKIVLTGNQMFDSSFQNEVKNTWTVSAYEFCTKEEFESLKSSPDYYFLMLVSGKFEGEEQPGIEMLSLMKGGLGYDNGVNGLLEVVSIPFRSSENPSGREFVVFPALLQIVQQFTLDSMEKDIQGYVGLSNYTLNLPRSKSMSVVFSKDDIAPEISPAVRSIYTRKGIEIMDADDVDDLMLDETPNTLISYVVAPSNPTSGSYCYKMLINTQDNTLFFFKRHKISKKYGAGFLVEDLKKIDSYRE